MINDFFSGSNNRCSDMSAGLHRKAHAKTCHVFNLSQGFAGFNYFFRVAITAARTGLRDLNYRAKTTT